MHAQAGACESVSSLDNSVLLTSLQLVAVQPACLRAHADTPLNQHGVQPAHELADHGPHHQQQHNDAAADLQHHQLLLQLRAGLTQQTTQHEPLVPRQDHQLQVSAITGGATASTCHLLPLPVQTAVLQVVLLNRQMQVLLHNQYSFQQLLQDQQQHQPPAQTPPSALAAGTSSAAAASSSRSVSSHSHSLDQELQLNIHLSAPSQPSAYLLDALHLFVSLCSEQLADPAGDQADPPAACLVAEMPLLVMPAPAQQEVQQLLLPAMRQDVQSEGQQQGEQLDAAAVAARALHVEQAVFRHFSQLSLDILLIMQLADAVRAEAAQASAGSAAHSAFESSQPLSPSAHHSSAAVAAAPAGAGAGASADAQQQTQQQQDEEGEGAEQALLHSSAMSNLLQAVHALLLPLLLPFLTAHGLHSTLQVLLQCLPPQLQLQQHWQQQQLARLQALTAQAQHQPDPDADVPQEQLQQLGLTDAAGTAAAAPQDGEVAVLSTSAVLDTMLQPPLAGSGVSDAPAGAECSCTVSSQSASVYKSGRSSPGPDSAAGDALEQQLQQLQPLRHMTGDADLAPGTPPAAADASAGTAGPGRSSSTANHGAGGSGQGSSSAWGLGQGHGSSAAGAGGLRRRGGPLSAAPAVGTGTIRGEQGGGQDGGNAADMFYCFGVLSQATSMPCWLVPFRQFQNPETERRYLAFKHQRLLYVDWLGGIYQIAMVCALLKHLQHPFTWVVLMMCVMKALPHVPLLLGGSSRRDQHIRFRELWMFLSAPGTALLFLACLFSNTWQRVAMQPMPPAFFSFLKVRGELTAAALRAFFHHQRLRPFLLYMALDRMVCVHLWAPFVGGAAALMRAALAGVVSVLMCWALELYFRRRFVLAGLYS